MEPLYDWVQKPDKSWKCDDFGAPGEPVPEGGWPLHCGDGFTVDLAVGRHLEPDSKGMVSTKWRDAKKTDQWDLIVSYDQVHQDFNSQSFHIISIAIA